MKFLDGTAWGGRRLWYWIPPAVFLLINLVAFVVYQTVYADEAAVSAARLERAETELARLEARRSAYEAQLQRIVDSRQRVRELYQEDFATEAERLTEILRTVRQLAREASLEPQANSYPKEELEDYGLTKRSFTFGVQGSYFNLRKLINSLELSDHFLTLEDVGLRESTGRTSGQLSIDLKLSTLFSEADTDYGLDTIDWTPPAPAPADAPATPTPEALARDGGEEPLEKPADGEAAGERSPDSDGEAGGAGTQADEVAAEEVS